MALFGIFAPKPEADYLPLVTLDGQYNVYRPTLYFKDGAEDQRSDNRCRYIRVEWEQTHAAADAPFKVFLCVAEYDYQMPVMTRAQLDVFKGKMQDATSSTLAFVNGFEPTANGVLKDMGFSVAARLVRDPKGRVPGSAPQPAANA